MAILGGSAPRTHSVPNDAALPEPAAGAVSEAATRPATAPQDHPADIDARDLQAADINVMADQVAADLLSDPRLNAGRERWTVVVGRMEDRTLRRAGRMNFDMYLQAIKARLARQGRGRVQLIADREQFYELRDRHAKGEGGGGLDDFGPGGGREAEALRPDYVLTGVARNLPGRGADVYQLEFTVLNVRTRQVAWSRLYALGGGRHGPDSAPADTAPATTQAAGEGVVVARGARGPALKLAVVTNNASDWWKIAWAGVDAYENEAEVRVDVRMPPSGRIEEQNRIIEDLADQGYDAIAVSVIAPQDQVAVLNRVAEKTKLITFDSDAPESNRLLYIGTSNYEAGKVLGGEVVTLMPDGGKVAVFAGSFAADNARNRLRGLEDAFKGHHVEIVERREDRKDLARARAEVDDVLDTRPDVDLLVGLWSYNGPAIAAALEGSGKKGKVKAAVFDEEEATLRAIETGTIQVTVVQRPFQFGYLASEWMHDLAANPKRSMTRIPADKVIDPGVDVIDKEKVRRLRKRLEEWTR